MIDIIYKKERPKILAIDFDETIVDNGFPNIETAVLKLNAKEIINKLFDEGFYIIIWTCRSSEDHINDAINLLNNNGIKFHKINDNYPDLSFSPYPKIYYDCIIDDKGLIDVDWLEIYNFIKRKFEC